MLIVCSLLTVLCFRFITEITNSYSINLFVVCYFNSLIM